MKARRATRLSKTPTISRTARTTQPAPETQARGAARLPSKDHRNSDWLQLVALAVSLLAWLRLIALDGDLAKAEPKGLRFQLLSAPARLARHARKKILKIPLGPRPGVKYRVKRQTRDGGGEDGGRGVLGRH